MKPCEIPCTKCGSTDVHRTYYPLGKPITLGICGHQDNQWSDNEFVTVLSRYVVEPKKEFVGHHCRVCQFSWLSDVLKPSDTPTP